MTVQWSPLPPLPHRQFTPGKNKSRYTEKSLILILERDYLNSNKDSIRNSVTKEEESAEEREEEKRRGEKEGSKTKSEKSGQELKHEFEK